MNRHDWRTQGGYTNPFESLVLGQSKNGCRSGNPLVMLVRHSTDPMVGIETARLIGPQSVKVDPLSSCSRPRSQRIYDISPYHRDRSRIILLCDMLFVCFPLRGGGSKPPNPLFWALGYRLLMRLPRAKGAHLVKEKAKTLKASNKHRAMFTGEVSELSGTDPSDWRRLRGFVV
jgi:hypothetical protein